MSEQREGVDPRTKRTLAKLEEAMTSLLREHSLGEINVSELCRVAGIHRTTFYKHFSSVTEFATAMFATWIDQLTLRGSDELPAAVPDLIASYEGALRAMLDHIGANRDIYRRMFASDGDYTFQRVLIDLLSERAGEAHRRFAERGQTIDVDEETAARMVGGACVAALGVWAGEDDSDSAARARQITAALPAWWQAA